MIGEDLKYVRNTKMTIKRDKLSFWGTVLPKSGQLAYTDKILAIGDSVNCRSTHLSAIQIATATR